VSTGTVSTVLPVAGAWIIRPPPTYIPTWWTELRLAPVAKKSRSPGRRSSASTGLPSAAWSWASRGMTTPWEAYTADVRPEQSHAGPDVPPHR